MGFDYFYGFVGGDANQWQPNLFRNTTPIYPFEGKPTWNLITAMADEAIQHMRMLNETQPDKPFFVYYVPGGTHAPHHPTPEWIKKISDMHLFDDGWNKLRETIFANQKKLGVIPPDAELTAWPDDLLKKWDDLTADEKKMFIRQADVFAAYAAYTDHEIGRVIQAVEDMGKLDDTLIIYITGDNGTSAEGSPIGTPSEVAAFNGVSVPVADQLKYFYDAWGTDQTYPHMAVGWTWAFDTPFKWTKQIASHFGGTRQGMAISWPERIKDTGGIRNQFHHMIDIVPTILEATGIQAPNMVDGIAQKPIEGVSMAYTFDAANAEAPSTRTTQYFEMLGNRGIYHDGWYANTMPISPPWELAGDRQSGRVQRLSVGALRPHQGLDPEQRPGRLEPRQAEGDAGPVRDRGGEVPGVSAGQLAGHPAGRAAAEHHRGAQLFTYTGVLTGTPNGDAPPLLNSSYTITAEVEVPQGGGDGMLVTQGGRFGGLRLLSAQGQAGLSVEPARPGAGPLGGQGRARPRQAHARVRLHL